MNTIKVFWKGKFNGQSVAINATDFNPAIHRLEADGDWPPVKTAWVEPEPEAIQEKPSQPVKAIRKPSVK